MDDFVIDDDDAKLTVHIDEMTPDKISMFVEQDSGDFTLFWLTPEQARQLSDYLIACARNIDYVKMMNKDLGIEENHD